MRDEKVRVFGEMRASYEALERDWGGFAGHDRWFAQPLGNARLASVAVDTHQVPAFEALLAACPRGRAKPAEGCRSLPGSPRPRCAAIRDHCFAARPVARTPRLRSAGPLHPPTPPPAAAGARFAYERHRPEDTTLYRVV